MRKLFYAAYLCVLALYGCSQKIDVLEDELILSEGETVSVQFALSMADLTKGSVAAAESKIYCLDIFLYRDGVLADQAFVTSLSSNKTTMELIAGYTYNVYALANVWNVEAPTREEDLETMEIVCESMADLEGDGVPFVASATLTCSSETTNSVILRLVRLISKVSFSFDGSALQGFTVNSVRVCQSASNVFPFAEKSAATMVMDGDYASASDIEAVNNGEEVSFYVLENCQGTLLAGNTDPWAKVPDNIPEKKDVCTYVEVAGEFDGSGGVSGEVLYRFFLGQDDLTNFDVIRNTACSVSLTATEDGLDETSWKIDNSSLVVGEVECELNLGQYPGQWGTITFSEATADNPVTISYGTKSISIPATTSSYLGNIGEEGPYLLVALAGSNTVNVCLGCGSRTYNVSQGSRSGTITLTSDDSLVFTAMDDSEEYFYSSTTPIEICEDGEDVYFWIYLKDKKTDKIIENSIINAPTAVATYLGLKDRNSLLYSSYYDIDCSENISGVYVTTYYSTNWALESYGEKFLYEGRIYAKSAESGTAGTITIFKNYLNSLVDGSIAVEVYPAFPNQRHIDDIVNNHVCSLGSDYSNSDYACFYTQGTKNASWTFGRGTKYASGDADEDIDEVMETGNWLATTSSTGGNVKLIFSLPTAVGNYQYLASGTFHFRGTSPIHIAKRPLWGTTAQISCCI